MGLACVKEEDSTPALLAAVSAAQVPGSATGTLDRARPPPVVILELRTTTTTATMASSFSARQSTNNNAESVSPRSTYSNGTNHFLQAILLERSFKEECRMQHHHDTVKRKFDRANHAHRSLSPQTTSFTSSSKTPREPPSPAPITPQREQAGALTRTISASGFLSYSAINDPQQHLNGSSLDVVPNPLLPSSSQ